MVWKKLSNLAAVAGVVSAGGGFINLTKLMVALNIRCMGNKTYEKHQPSRPEHGKKRHFKK